jgi:hypothetical protein
MTDLAEVIERIVPQAAYQTARATDIDADDYAALERTWFDLRPLPTRAVVDAERLVIEQERAERLQERQNRLSELLQAISDQPPQVTNAEILAANSVADIKLILAKLARSQRLFRALFAILRNREDVSADGD